MQWIEFLLSGFQIILLLWNVYDWLHFSISIILNTRLTVLMSAISNKLTKCDEKSISIRMNRYNIGKLSVIFFSLMQSSKKKNKEIMEHQRIAQIDMVLMEAVLATFLNQKTQNMNSFRSTHIFRIYFFHLMFSNIFFPSISRSF